MQGDGKGEVIPQAAALYQSNDLGQRLWRFYRSDLAIERPRPLHPELGGYPPASIGRGILALGIAYARQERAHGGISERLARELDRLLDRTLRTDPNDVASRRKMPVLRSGTILVREWQGTTHHVTIVDDGFVWNGQTHRSLSSIARTITGTKWNGPRFFGMRQDTARASRSGA